MYEIRLHPDANQYIQHLDSKSQRIVKNNLRKLKNEPYPRPNNKLGDAEKVTVDGEEYYRLHISRSHTAFYRVKESEDRYISST